MLDGTGVAVFVIVKPMSMSEGHFGSSLVGEHPMNFKSCGSCELRTSTVGANLTGANTVKASNAGAQVGRGNYCAILRTDAMSFGLPDSRPPTLPNVNL